MAAAESLPLPTGTQGKKSWFGLLWLTWAVLLVGSMVVGNGPGGHGSPLSTWLRMGASLTLVATGSLSYGLFRASPAGPFAWWILIGMMLGTIGDFFLAGLLKFLPIPEPFLAGMAAFGLGHIAYIIGCVGLSKRASLNNRRTMLIAIVAWQLIGIAAWYYVVYLGTQARPMIWMVLPYCALLAGTAGVTLGLALQNRKLGWLALGGALFLLSDLLIACGMFRGSFPHQTEWVWLTYSPGQMLIVFSVLSAVDVMRRIRET